MARVSLSELIRRLGLHGLTAPHPDRNTDLAAACLGADRTLTAVRLVIHSDPGIGLPALLLELEGPSGREVLPVSPGPRSFQLLSSRLGEACEIETELADAPSEGPLAKLATIARSTSGAVTSELVSGPIEPADYVFNRIVCEADLSTASGLMRSTMDVLLEELNAERGIVALARGDGVLRPEIARLQGRRDLGNAAQEVPRHVFERVARKRSAEFIEDVGDPTISLHPSRSMHEKRVKSYAAAPLLEEGEVVGIIYLDRRISAARFDAGSKVLFEQLAQRMGVVLSRTLSRDDAPELDLTEELGLLNIVGRSAAMRRVFEEVRRIARQDVNAIILGEMGTGKELVANALHQLGPRKEEEFRAMSCAQLTDSTLLESVLFGHVKGAFTGADSKRDGMFRTCNGGTLFLDEFGDMPSALQDKLLRTLECGEIHPLGADCTLKVDVRLIWATNRDVGEAIQNGSFRADLADRLDEAERILMPPLRERTDDIGILAESFLERAAAAHHARARRFHPGAIERLCSYHWPGNVRELRNVVLHSVRKHEEVESLRPEHLEFQGLRPVQPRLERVTTTVVPHAELMRGYLENALIAANGNVSVAAEMIGRSRTTVSDWLKKFGVREVVPRGRRNRSPKR